MPRRDSDSESDRTSHRKKSKRSRRNSSSESHGDSDSSSTRKHRHHNSRHNSRSRSRSRESRRKEWKHSRSPKRRTRRSRSSSVSRHNSRSRSRSSSRSKTRRTRRSRSRSGSRSFKNKSSKRHRRSASRSRSKSPRSKSSSVKVLAAPPEKESDKLKRKVQQALKAAAHADAELREKGLLGGETTSTSDFLSLGSSTASFSEQLRRAQTLEEINAPSFTQQQFLSTRSGTKSSQKTEDFLEKDAHSAAIFGLSAPKLGVTSLSSDASIKKLETWKENPMMLVHHSLFGDEEGKQERWVKKLLAMRRKLVSGEGL